MSVLLQVHPTANHVSVGWVQVCGWAVVPLSGGLTPARSNSGNMTILNGLEKNLCSRPIEHLTQWGGNYGPSFIYFIIQMKKSAQSLHFAWLIAALPSPLSWINYSFLLEYLPSSVPRQRQGVECVMSDCCGCNCGVLMLTNSRG